MVILLECPDKLMLIEERRIIRREFSGKKIIENKSTGPLKKNLTCLGMLFAL